MLLKLKLRIVESKKYNVIGLMIDEWDLIIFYIENYYWVNKINLLNMRKM